MRKILVATDFSPSSEAAGRAAIELAQKFGASLTLLHAYAVPTYLFFDGSTYVPPSSTVASIVADAAHRLEQAKQLTAGSGVAVDTQLHEGAPADTIAGFAADHGFDLVVIGMHGRRGLARLGGLGSVTEHVVRTSRVPVLTVPAPPRRP